MMRKFSSGHGVLKSGRQKRAAVVSKNKYLRPGALAQLRFNKASSEIVKKMLSASKPRKTDRAVKSNSSPLLLSPISVKPGRLLVTPKAHRREHDSMQGLELLPIDLLVKIMCHLHHDQLKAVFHVSTTLRRAVLVARQNHFNYRTPDRSRQEMLRTVTPSSADRWPFKRVLRSPHTPKAPRQGPRPPSRMRFSTMCQVSAVLFPESSPWMPPRSLLQRPLFGSSRALSYEDELCEAVAHNKFI